MWPTDLENAYPFILVDPDRFEGDGVHVVRFNADGGRHRSRLRLKLSRLVPVDQDLAMRGESVFVGSSEKQNAFATSRRHPHSLQ